MKSNILRCNPVSLAYQMMRGAAAFSVMAGLAFSPAVRGESLAVATSLGASGIAPGEGGHVSVACDRLLELAAYAEGNAYERALETLLAAHASELPARVASSLYTEQSWRKDVVAAFALARLVDATAPEHLSQLPGLQPLIYLDARRAEPTALRDLRALRAQKRVDDVALAEVLWTRAVQVSLSTAEDFPPAHQKSYGAWRTAESAALLDGLILVLGDTQARAAHFVLRDVLNDESLDVRHRALAASALGQTRSDLAEDALLRATASPLAALREGAITGLGRLGSVTAIQKLRTYISSDASPGEFRVTIGALGRAGARATRAHHSEDNDAERLTEIGNALQDALARAKDPRDIQATIEAICVVADERALPALERAASDHPDPVRYERAARSLRRTLARLR